LEAVTEAHFEKVVNKMATCLKNPNLKENVDPNQNTGRDAPGMRPDNSAVLISGIRADTGFDLPDIRLDNENSRISYHANS
jgi:hypothetical protein